EEPSESRWELRPGRAVIESGALRYLDAANETDILVGIASTAEGSRTVADLSGISTSSASTAAGAEADSDSDTDTDNDSGGAQQDAPVRNPDMFVSGGGTWEGNEFTLEGSG